MNRFFLASLLVFGFVSWETEAMPGLVAERLRMRRSSKRQSLTDPQDCIKQCMSDHTSSLAEISSTFKLKLIMKKKELGIPDGAPANDKALKSAAIDNVREMFGQMCKRWDTTNDCLQSCPKSDLQQLTLIQHKDDRDQVCYPINGNMDFNEFYNAESCLKSVRAPQCDQQCGRSSSVEASTGFKFDESGSAVEFDPSKSKNADAAKKACVNIQCLVDCNKPLMLKQCGQNVYDLFVRWKKYEPAATLASLRYLGALGSDEPSECAAFR